MRSSANSEPWGVPRSNKNEVELQECTTVNCIVNIDKLAIVAELLSLWYSRAAAARRKYETELDKWMTGRYLPRPEYLGVSKCANYGFISATIT